MSEQKLKCTEYCYYANPEQFPPCQCPVCGGFLKWIGEKSDIPVCNKCGTELIIVPEKDEETGRILGCGKICPISLPKKRF